MLQANASQPQAPSRSDLPAPQPSQPPQLRIDDSAVVSDYANFCRMTGTPEELLIDFGLNPEPFGAPAPGITVTQRIITSYYTAKRMLRALELTLHRHEATFGVLELDVQRRVRPGHPG